MLREGGHRGAHAHDDVLGEGLGVLILLLGPIVLVLDVWALRGNVVL